MIVFMRYVLALLCLAAALQAQNASPSGKWVSDMKFFGNDNYAHLELALGGNKLTGKLGNDIFEGTFESALIEATVAGGPRRRSGFVADFKATASSVRRPSCKTTRNSRGKRRAKFR